MSLLAASRSILLSLFHSSASQSNAVDVMQRPCRFFNVTRAARHNCNRRMQLKKIISFSDESQLWIRPRQIEISVQK
jgi:hypothetical protein